MILINLQEWLNYISTELHKQFTPLFNSGASDEWKQTAREGLSRRFDYVSSQLTGKSHILGGDFTVADCYLFTVLRWTKWVKVDLRRWPTLHEYVARIAQRPAVEAALAAEGIST